MGALQVTDCRGTVLLIFVDWRYEIGITRIASERLVWLAGKMDL
jgi:hypothetical protein